ncbi:unnamed protein product [Linum trigynum]|uniref:Uncharacterized protein n=1 Tax=Linum trigynum TaxID=586398 RepID=A0AAV2GFK3_9ROSI
MGGTAAAGQGSRPRPGWKRATGHEVTSGRMAAGRRGQRKAKLLVRPLSLNRTEGRRAGEWGRVTSSSGTSRGRDGRTVAVGMAAAQREGSQQSTSQGSSKG